MSEEKLRRNAERWYRQAEDDLGAARALLEAERFAQSAFLAQQKAEKAMKAVWIVLDLDPWGHSVGRLIKDLPEDERPYFDSRLEDALSLDKLYIPTRYPDALADLTPAEAYTRSEAQNACNRAAGILEKAGKWLKKQE